MFADGVMEGTSSTGLDDFVLTGPVYNGLAFNQKFTNGQACAFIAQTLKREKYEIIAGVYQDGPPRKLIRSTVLSSSAGGTKVDWQPDDIFYISSFASADALAGVCQGNLLAARPWWIQFGLWLRKNFPVANIHQWNFWDGSADIPFGKVDPVNHIITLDLRVLPAGLRFGYGGSVAPAGSLLERGQSLLRASYPPLFTAIGTNWGAVDGTHFNVPDSRGRTDVGFDPDNTNRLSGDKAEAIGNVFGDEVQDPDVEVTGSGLTAAGYYTGTAYGSMGVVNSGPAIGNHSHDIPQIPVSLTLSATYATLSSLQPSIVGPKIITINQ